MVRTWTETGREYVCGDPADDVSPDVQHETASEQRVAAALDAAAVLLDTPPDVMAAMPGLGIKAAVTELGIPKVSRISVSTELAPYGLYAIEGNYGNGRAVIFVLDRGSDLLVIASDFEPVTKTQETPA